MEIAQLAAHLSTDPDNRGYSGMSDAAVAADMQTLRRLGVTRMTYLSLASQLEADIVRRLIEAVDAAAVSDVLVDKIRQRLERDEMGGVDISHETVRAMLDSFAQNQLLSITGDDAHAIKSLAENKTSDAEYYGLGSIEEKHVRWARG